MGDIECGERRSEGCLVFLCEIKRAEFLHRGSLGDCV